MGACNHIQRYFSCLFLVGMATMVSGCSGSRSLAGIFPPDPPTAAAVKEEQKGLDDIWNNFSPTATGDVATAQEFLSAGFRRADTACTTFFTASARLQSETSFAKDALTSAVSAAGVISALASAPTAVLTGMFGAAGLFPKTVDDFNQIFLFASVSDELSGQIKGAMDQHSSQNPIDTFQCNGRADCQRKATSLVHDHAYFCTISNLKHVVKTSVSNSCVGSAPTDGTQAKAPANCPGTTTSTVGAGGKPAAAAAAAPAAGGTTGSAANAGSGRSARVLMKSGPVVMFAPQ